MYIKFHNKFDSSNLKCHLFFSEEHTYSYIDIHPYKPEWPNQLLKYLKTYIYLQVSK